MPAATLVSGPLVRRWLEAMLEQPVGDALGPAPGTDRTRGGLPYSHSNALRAQQMVVAPPNMWRAEEYLRASVEEAVTIEQIAQAAGSSIPHCSSPSGGSVRQPRWKHCGRSGCNRRMKTLSDLTARYR